MQMSLDLSFITLLSWRYNFVGTWVDRMDLFITRHFPFLALTLTQNLSLIKRLWNLLLENKYNVCVCVLGWNSHRIKSEWVKLEATFDFHIFRFSFRRTSIEQVI
jgi:hypothetical protein